MKKIMLFVLLLWSIGYFIPTEAEIFEDNPLDNRSSFMLTPEKEFNVLKGISTEEDLNSSHFLLVYWQDIDDYLEEGAMSLSAVIHSAFEPRSLKTIFYASNNQLCRYQAYLDDDLFYEFVVENKQAKITVCEELDLNEIIGYTEEGFTMTSDFKFSFSPGSIYHFYDEHEIPTGYIPDDEFIENIGFKCIYAMKYAFNPIYAGEEVHFITEASNPISLEEILASLKAYDETDGEITDICIIRNTYLIKNNMIEPGSYTLTLRAVDFAGNTTLQECIVDVYDYTPPVITGKDARIYYFNEYSLENILGLFTVKELSSYTLEIIQNDYTPNHNIPGVYAITARATDAYGNTSEAIAYITVLDPYGPVITVQRNIRITTKDAYTLEDFESYIQISDECDGVIQDYSITDIDGYINHPATAGVYSFRVEALDSSGNKASAVFSVHVLDLDYPILEVKEYVIVVPAGYTITKEKVMEILINTGQLEDKTAAVASFYFEEEEPYGSYELMVTDEKGNIFNNELQIMEQKIKDYTPIPSQPKSTKGIIYGTAIGIAGGMVILFLGLSVVIYKKRH